MRSRVISVKAIWDEDAQVWVATSEDVPGLATEADTLEELTEKLKIILKINLAQVALFMEKLI